jgi:hypothetical protein
VGRAGPGDLVLPPELVERLRRIGVVEGKTPGQVLCDAVGEYWVRFACRQRFSPKDW